MSKGSFSQRNKRGNSTARWRSCYFYASLHPDIELLISLLTTRMKEPDEGDWGKIKHGLMYLKGTLHMKRYIKMDSLIMIRWWVDASYGVHWYCKGPTWAMLSMGKGALVNITIKHKLNTGSSTEVELVIIADVLGIMMWCKYFMEAQGYSIENNILYQDNKSIILLANNGRTSSGKNSKHIKNRFFYSLIRLPWGISISNTRARIKCGPM